MTTERSARIALGLSASALALALALAAVVPLGAWSPGSRQLVEAPVLERSRVLSASTGLRVEVDDGVLVSTGDGGGAGAIEGFDRAPIRVRAATFRDVAGWEIGTAPDRPAAYVDDNGIRLDDGMADRLRARAWPVPVLLTVLALAAWALTRKAAARPRFIAPGLLLLAALTLAAPLL